MKAFSFLIAAVLSMLLVSAQQSEEVGVSSPDIIFSIEHFLNGKFVPRTKVHVVKKADGKQGLVFPEKNGIFADDISTMKSMLDRNSLYTIRVQSHIGNYSSRPVVSSLPLVS